MPNNITQIPAPRVPVIDAKTGLMSREWYRFFVNLFDLTGEGSNTTSLTDLQVGPPPIETLPGGSSTQVQYNNGGSFGGASTFTYTSGTDTLTVGKLVSANFTSSAQGLVPASGGGTTNFLRADGNFVAPPTTAPASPTTSVQFNNAGVFGGSANFLYDTGTNTFTVGPAGATTTIETLAPTGSTVAGTLRFRGKNASATNGAGGGLQFAGGTALGTGTGGGMSFTAGSSPSGIGGGISFNASAGASGGSLTFDSGTGLTGPAGSILIQAAAGNGATSTGGSFNATAGNAANNGNGGDIVVLSGNSLGSGLGGSFDFRCGFGAGGSGSMTFSTDNFTIIQLTEDSTPVAQLGFYGTVPVAQAAAYTKTYSTASRTIPVATFTNLVTTAATNVAPYGFTTQAQADAIATKVNALAADVLILKQLIVSLVNDSSTTLGVGLNAT